MMAVNRLCYTYRMMGYGGGWGMMEGATGLGIIAWVAVIVDLVLLGVWLWKQIQK